MDTHIFLVHGLGANWMTMLPIKWSLERRGYTRVDTVSYPCDLLDLEGSVQAVSNEIERCLIEKYGAGDAKEKEIVVIGQSLGGVVCNRLHTKGWRVRGAVYFVSPLGGSAVLRWCRDNLSDWMLEKMEKPVYECLTRKQERPPHRYLTVGASWPFLGFDGRVFADEMKFGGDGDGDGDGDWDRRESGSETSLGHHKHLWGADHCLIVLDPRLHNLIGEFLESL